MIRLALAIGAFWFLWSTAGPLIAVLLLIGWGIASHLNRQEETLREIRHKLTCTGCILCRPDLPREY